MQALRDAIGTRRSFEEARRGIARLLLEGDRAESVEFPRRLARGEGEDAARYDAMLDRLAAQLGDVAYEIDASARLAVALGEELQRTMRTSPEAARERTAPLGDSDRIALADWLGTRAAEVALDDPQAGMALAELGIFTIAGRGVTGPRARGAMDSLAQAHLGLAEAAFRAGDLLRALAALAEAKTAAAEGSLEPILEGNLLRIESEIRSDQSQHAEARRLAQRSVATFKQCGERRREARGRLSLALKYFYEGRLDSAQRETERALALVDPERDRRLVLAARFNLAFWANDAGQTAAVRSQLPALRTLAAECGRELDRVRVDWLEARVEAREGAHREAIARYRAVLDRCLELETLYDSATVALELATVLVEAGRPAEVLALAESVAPIFAAQGVETEAIGAVLLAADALRRGTAAHVVLAQILRPRDPNKAASH
jgi:tetratricopeptide (TPR) repeat protein